MTEGILLKEAVTGPTLSKYACIIDEAHERTVNTDMLLTLLRALLAAAGNSR